MYRIHPCFGFKSYKTNYLCISYTLTFVALKHEQLWYILLPQLELLPPNWQKLPQPPFLFCCLASYCVSHVSMCQLHSLASETSGFAFQKSRKIIFFSFMDIFGTLYFVMEGNTLSHWRIYEWRYILLVALVLCHLWYVGQKCRNSSECEMYCFFVIKRWWWKNASIVPIRLGVELWSKVVIFKWAVHELLG